MARAKAARNSDGRAMVRIHCPGCDESHVLAVDGAGRPNWGFNGDLDRPTLTPSILVTSGHYSPGWTPDKKCWCSPPPDGEEGWGFACERCHSFVTDGRIQFLDDCTHALKGQTVDLPEIEEADHDA